MGFGKKSRKEAKRQQEEAYRRQQRQADQYDAMTQAYRNNFDKRNEYIIGLNERSGQRIEQFDRGEDITRIYPLLANTLTQGANAVRNTMDYTSGLGTNAYAQQDERYLQKLKSVAGRDISKALATAMVQGTNAERDRDTNLLMETSQYLNADRMAGFGLANNSFNMANTMFGNATTKRQMEIQRSNAMMGNLMNIIGGGLSGFSMAGGFGLFMPKSMSSVTNTIPHEGGHFGAGGGYS